MIQFHRIANNPISQVSELVCLLHNVRVVNYSIERCLDCSCKCVDEIPNLAFARFGHQVVSKFIPESVECFECVTVCLVDESERLSDIDLLPKAHPIQIQYACINNVNFENSIYKVFHPQVTA